MSLRHLLASATIALALLSPVASASTVKVELRAMRDGGIEIEGTEYRTVTALREKLKSIAARTPKPDVVWVTQEGADFKSVLHAIVLIQDTGVFPKMAFVLKPPQK